MKYEVRFTTQFKKDLKLAKKQGKDSIEKPPALLKCRRKTQSLFSKGYGYGKN